MGAEIDQTMALVSAGAGLALVAAVARPARVGRSRGSAAVSVATLLAVAVAVAAAAAYADASTGKRADDAQSWSTPQGIARAWPVTVRPGDSLWRLAAASDRSLCGAAADRRTATQWPRWYRLNRHVIGSDPDLLLPGQRLARPRPGRCPDDLVRGPPG
jgi:nucleoid-associated protein YgaU